VGFGRAGTASWLAHLGARFGRLAAGTDAGPPDWICEVLSSSTARVDRAVKMPIYAAQGIPFLWLIDPDLHTLEVFVLSEGRWSLERVCQESDPVSAPPFEAVTFALSDLWT